MTPFFRHLIFIPVLCCAMGADPQGDKASALPVALPKVDLRPEFAKFKLDVRQQGKRGACQVFALVGVIEYQLAKHGKPADLSEQFIMWAANEANSLDLTEGFNPDFLIAGMSELLRERTHGGRLLQPKHFR